MNQTIILLGAGGHAKVLIDALARHILFATDANPALHGQTVAGIPIAGSDEMVFQHRPEDIRLVQAIGSTRCSSARRKLFEQFKQRGYHFAQVIHPSAIVSRSAQLGEGAQIMAGAVVQCGCQIGANVLINTRVSIDHDCHIGPHTHIAPGVTLSGGVHIGPDCHIGAGATIIENRVIGRGALIGAGAVVLTDIPDGATAWGVPAKVVTVSS